MRGTPPLVGSDAACPGTMFMASGSAAHVGRVRGSVAPLPDVPRCSAPRCVRDSDHTTGHDRPVLSPPMFVFQHRTTPMKRRAEDEGNGAVVSKRVRSLTYPSLLSRTRKGPCDSGRRVRSSSLSFPPPLSVSRSNVFTPSNTPNLTKVPTATLSPRGKVSRTLLRPALLVAPGLWNGRDNPQTRKISLDAEKELSSVTFDLASSAKSLEQRTLFQASRSFSPSDTALAGSVQFVFGENMSERVLSPQRRPCSEDTSESDCSSTESDSSGSEAEEKSAVCSSLWESAAAYTASCRRRCLLKRVRVCTGEENESNVVQLTCKLFILERGTHSWSERGRGVLRLNDLESGAKGCLQSRLVMRHQGSLRVILNTKLYPHTHLQRPARRNLQVTATDLESGGLRVFLIQAGARDIARLYVAIHHRLVGLRCSSTGITGESAALADRDGRCSSEGEEDEDEKEEREAPEETVLIAHPVPGECKWRHSHSRFCS